jgi:hypothetical protein
VICSDTVTELQPRVHLADVADVQDHAALHEGFEALKLDAEACTRRCEAARFGTGPRSSLTSSLVALVSRWVSRMVAPGTAASLESTTVPTMTAVLALLRPGRYRNQNKNGHHRQKASELRRRCNSFSNHGGPLLMCHGWSAPVATREDLYEEKARGVCLRPSKRWVDSSEPRGVS